MYERNAIVLERYFDKLFGYDQKSNLKNNYSNYTQLIELIEKYQDATSEEDKVISEYDEIINKIKEIQKIQELLSKKDAKLQESRKGIFENIDENVESLRRKLEKIEEETQKNNDEMKQNGENYINELNEFNDKSLNRNQCSRNRRIVEGDYQKQLKDTITNINDLSVEKVNEVKNFFKSENNIQDEIQQKIIQNGAREKIPFDLRVMEKAIDLETDIEQQETEILCAVYDRTHRLLVEIKNDAVKLEKHKKLIRDSESRLSFLNAMKEYLTLFLDNERLNIVGGEKEHRKLMSEASENLEKDFIQIKNLYTLLGKEIIGRATKKMYKDLYNPQYLYDLEEHEKEFENNISKLNVIGTVIYPDYWRIEGMQKIYNSFKTSVQEIYDRDLTEFEPVTSSIEEEEIIEKKKEQEILSQINDDYEDDEIEDEDFVNEETKEVIDNENNEDQIEETQEESQTQNKDKEIDEILGFYNFDSELLNDDTDEDDSEENDDEEYINEELEDEDTDEYNKENDDDEDEDDFGDDEGYDNIDFDEDDEEVESNSNNK